MAVALARVWHEKKGRRLSPGRSRALAADTHDRISTTHCVSWQSIGKSLNGTNSRDEPTAESMVVWPLTSPWEQKCTLRIGWQSCQERVANWDPFRSPGKALYPSGVGDCVTENLFLACRPKSSRLDSFGFVFTWSPSSDHRGYIERRIHGPYRLYADNPCLQCIQICRVPSDSANADIPWP